jgi:Arc/MetJ-type ribon-helix-helix transcriptional regulator
MKVSVSLPDEDLAFLDSYARDTGIPSRSAVMHKAVDLLRASQLGDAYEQAWAEWAAAGDDDAEDDAWDAVTGDGLEG